MKRETYKTMTETIRNDVLLGKFIKSTDKLFTNAIYLIYPALIIYLFVKGNPHVWEAILVPGISFVAVSIFRNVYNAPRPYEVFGLPAVLDKNSPGKSFPSRHVFSVFVIAVTVFYFYPIAGLLIGFVGCNIALNRVLGGVHFPKDVIAGALIGIISGVIGYYLIVPLV